MSPAAATMAFTGTAQTMRLYGEVGLEVLASDVAAALDTAHGRPVTINLFSYGGSAAEGLAIYNLLQSYSGRVEVIVDGVAASSASLLAMGADRLVLPENALLMLHDPWAMASGNADAMRSSADMLDTFTRAYVEAYARKSGASLEQVAAWMAAGNGAGTWFTAAEALAAGLADEVAPPAEIRATAPRLPAGRFPHPPAALLALASAIESLNPPNPIPMTAQSQTAEAAALAANPEAAAADGELSRAEANRQLQVHRSAALAGLSTADAEQIIASTKTTQEGLMAVITAHASAVEGRAGAAGHPARQYVGPSNGQPGGIEGIIHAALRGERGEPVWLALRAAGLGHGADPASVWRTALSGGSRWTARGDLGTSDLPTLLTLAGNRRLMERFGVADSGVRLAATVRRLVDYRSASVVDVGMVGSAQMIKEGGEITFSSVDESAASYKPSRYGLGLAFTVEAMANDDLAALDQAIAELADAHLDSEAVALVDLIEGTATGRNAPDGKPLFHADHANSVSAGPLSIAAIGSAVALLRNQKALGGRYIAQEPAAILCGTAAETSVRQLLSDAINANQAANVNPWRNLQIAVEPRLSGNYAYVLGSGRRALELGRLTDGPQLTSEREFMTSAFLCKSEHVFGAIVQEYRSIVRIPTAA